MWGAKGFAFLLSDRLSAYLSAMLSANACKPWANRYSDLDFQSVSFFGNVANNTVAVTRVSNTVCNGFATGRTLVDKAFCLVNLPFALCARAFIFSHISHVSPHVAHHFTAKVSKIFLFRILYVHLAAISHQSGVRVNHFQEQFGFTQSCFFNKLNITSMN
jgi:hypothetical protein